MLTDKEFPELLLPAGTLQKLRVAFAYGADAVYAGAAGFSMRPNDASFSVEDLRAGAIHAKELGRKLYVCLNIMAFPGEIPELKKWLEETSDIQFDAFIIGDAGILNVVRRMRPDMPIHISTQLGVANHESAKFWADNGASRVVLARECSLDDAKKIRELSGVDTEMFVHGAMCVAVSGRCLLSAHMAGKSGSRGECKHSCRWDYKLVEEKRPDETFPIVETDLGTIFLGSRDLCLIEHLPQILSAGVSSLKIEGRMKSEYYVATVARTYRAALDALKEQSGAFDPAWIDELNSITHRPYSTGFAFGYKDPAALQAVNKYSATHEVVGFVSEGGEHVVVKNPFHTGQMLEWLSPEGTTGELRVSEITEENGAFREAARPSTRVRIDCLEMELPPYAMLRRRKSQE